VEKTVEKKVWFSNQVLIVSKTRKLNLFKRLKLETLLFQNILLNILSKYILSHSIFIERIRLKQKKIVLVV
jgi:hypothetical protein